MQTESIRRKLQEETTMTRFVPGTVVLILTICLACPGTVWTDAPQKVSAEIKADGVHITVGGRLFTVYKTEDTQKYPYFFPVNGPASGTSVTTETSEPYPHHHSLFFGCDHVNGGNYWQDVLDRGQIVSEKVRLLEKGGTHVLFTDQCVWRRPGAPVPFRDERTVAISAPSGDIRYIDFQITVTAQMDVHITKTNHSLFSARMVPELSVNEGGTLINAHGDLKEEGTFGKSSPWCDYSGSRDGVVEGLAIFDHPRNPWYPSRWFTRDYGFFSPTEMNWLPGGEVHIPKGEQYTLRYRVVVHTGSAEEAKIGEEYEDWAK